MAAAPPVRCQVLRRRARLWLAPAAIVPLLVAGLPAQTPRREPVHLVVGRPVSVPVTRGSITLVLVEASAGDVIRLTVRRPAPFIITLADAGGDTVRTRARVEPLDSPEHITFVAVQAGVHRVELHTRGVPDARGAHAIVLDERRPSTPDDGRRAEAERLLEEADALRQRGTSEQTRAAMALYDSALDSWRALGDPRGEADALLGRGLAHRALSEDDLALEAYAASLGPRRAGGDNFGEAFTLQNIALVHRTRGDFATAEDFYTQARDVAGRHDDERALADALNGLARVAAELGDVQGSLDLLAEVLPRSAAIGDLRGEAYALNAMGNAHFYAGDFDRARDFYTRGLSVRRAIGDRQAEANSLANLGAVALAEDDAAGALARGREGLALARQLGNRRAEAEQQQVIGWASQRLGRHAQAVSALEIAASANAAAGDRRHEATALEPLAVSLASLGRMAEARTAAARALALRRALGDSLGEAQSLDAMAEVEVRGGELETAAVRSKAALDAFESQRVRLNSQSLRSAFVAASHAAFERHVDVHMRLAGRDPSSPHVAEAFHAAERARARGLLDALGQARVPIGSVGDEALQSQERDARRRVDLASAALASIAAGAAGLRSRDEAEAALDRAIFEYEQVDARIRAERRGAASLADAAPLTLAEVRRDVVDEGSVLLEYALGRERSWLWAVTRESVRVFPLPGRSVIEQAARAVHAAAQISHRPGRGAAARYAAAELSRIILAPAAGILGDRRLLVVPDGALHIVPFAGLPRPGGTGMPLIERHEMVVLPSASVVPAIRAATRARPAGDRPLAVFADPVLGASDPRLSRPRQASTRAAGSNESTSTAASQAPEALAAAGPGVFARLPFARREASSIAAVVKRPGGVKIALDFDASRRAVLDPSLARYRMVHFATHALVNLRRPALSGIVLSLVTPDGAPQDGFLRLHDLYSLRLGADLVVLSACQTALGPQIRGEGLVSLTRGFMHAGVPSVVASLWNVRDEPTAELMTRFYQRLSVEGLSPPAAMRAAQRSMLADPAWAAPSNWAAFVAHGDWR